MYIATIVGLAFVWFHFWRRFHDPFHPAIFLLPQFAFLYGYMPMELSASDPERFAQYANGDAVVYYQAVTVGLIASLVFGVVWASRRVTKRKARWQMLKLRSPRRVQIIAGTMGTAGLLAWLTMVSNAGGFAGAYGSGYGGGWASSGYIREMRYLGLVGALLTYMSRTGKSIRPMDWALIALCITPTLVHAILGARRGPLFLAVVVLGGGYFYFMRKRIPVHLLVTAGVALGLAMLFLVANRNSIYLGADVVSVTLRDPTEHLLRWSSNEYLIGNAVVQYTDDNGAFYGRRELAWLIGRLLPSFVWPTIWNDLPGLLGLTIDLRVNGGVSQEGLTTVANWTPSVGSAEGFTGSLYLEFGWLSPVAAFAIGAFYGKVWRSAKSSLAARVVYLLMVAMSVYLVMQSLDPWLYRIILFGLPAYLALRWVKARPVEAEILSGGKVRAVAERRPRKRTLQPYNPPAGTNMAP